MTLLLLLVDIAIVAALTVFLAFVVRGLGKSVKARLKRGFVDSLAIYDELIDAKSRELAALDGQRADDAPSEVVSPARCQDAPLVGSTPGAPFAHKTFVRAYRMARDSFSFSPTEAARDVLSRIPDSQPELVVRCRAAREIRSMLDHETLFDLISLPYDLQLEVISGALVGTQLEVLRAYLSERTWAGAIDFARWLDAVIASDPEHIVITVGENAHIEAGGLSASRPVCITRDPEICEGILVRSGSTLFDYALRSKDFQ